MGNCPDFLQYEYDRRKFALHAQAAHGGDPEYEYGRRKFALQLPACLLINCCKNQETFFKGS